MSREHRLTSKDFYNTEDLVEDAVLDSNDPLYDIQRLSGLNVGKLQEYKGEGTVSTEGSNISHTANEKIQYQQQHNIQPGTPEWFRLWFSLPYLTGEKPY